MESFSNGASLNNQSGAHAPGAIYDWGLFDRDVRIDVRNCVLFVVFFLVINGIAASIVQAVYIAIAAYSGAGNPDELSAAIYESLSVVGLTSIVGIICGSCVFFIMRKRRFITDLALPAAEPMTPKILIILIVATQGIQCANSLIVTMIDALLPSGISVVESYGEAIDSLFTPLGVLYIVIIGPIFEELIFRGAALETLRRFGDNFAIIISALIFGFYHMTIMQIPFCFVLGLLLGYVAVRWSLRAAIVLHIVTNGISVLISDTNSEAIMVIGGLALFACLIVTIAMVIYWRKPFHARIRAGAAYYPQTYKNGFSSIALWAFIFVTAAIGVFQIIALADLPSLFSY